MPRKFPDLGIIFIDDADANDNYALDASGTYTKLWGNSRANRLEGNAFDNYLNGDGGDDTLVGGQGNDTYRVDQPADVITELAGEGVDTVWSTVGYTLGANVENLILDESGGLNLDATGNELANRITGNSDANFLFGLIGDDTLDGGAGDDEMTGGVGNDVYVVDAAGDVVIEMPGEGIDTVMTFMTYSLADKPNVENITLMGSGAINATGNDGNNVLRGNAGANVLTGGLGDDTYYVGAGDQVVETAAGGTADQVFTDVTHTLADFVENLNATGSSPIGLTGNSLDNKIYGNSGANAINGGAGNDFLHGDLGRDVLMGGTGKDTFVFNTKPSSGNVDKVVDFRVKDDTVWLDNAIFKKLGSGSEASPKKLSGNFFNIGTKADDRNDYLIYNNKNGFLYYDADGSGSGKAVLIATLSKNLKMTVNDFYVI
jgi:Ca2+-binding RTX toxin-like protein